MSARPRNWPGSGGPLFTGARDLAGDSEDGYPLAWVLVEDARLLGCTVMLSTTPVVGWTDEERAEPAVVLSGTWTHPDYRRDRLGRLIVRWAEDHAARRGVKWVRCTVWSMRLVYYLADLGWSVVRQAGHCERHPEILMQCRPRRHPGLSALVAEVSPALAPENPVATSAERTVS
ncbi:GNAT family N-acetyltransferase [Streptomyces pactum]|uniref:GNAT family N-acetyltransferase n=1 Tax=Streptomyces pactum TaxID=68249 RepID=A0ABS0NFX5_9ACTN|nr:GNAT family N-acetyltransferase [Streptomyces pactum]MBH5334024.1 GNAT family N-acetyltransferase [Streptomyces pactum]